MYKRLVFIIVAACSLMTARAIEIVDKANGYKLDIGNHYNQIADETDKEGISRAIIALDQGQGLITVRYFPKQYIDSAVTARGGKLSALELPDDAFYMPDGTYKLIEAGKLGKWTTNLYEDSKYGTVRYKKTYKCMVNGGLLLLWSTNGLGQIPVATHDAIIKDCLTEITPTGSPKPTVKPENTDTGDLAESVTPSEDDEDYDLWTDPNLTPWQKFCRGMWAWIVKFLLVVPLTLVMALAVLYFFQGLRVGALVAFGIFVVVSLLMMWWIDAFNWAVALFAAVAGAIMGFKQHTTGSASLPDID